MTIDSGRDERCSASILVVEDDASIRQDLAEILADEGYGVVQASNGSEALEKLRSVSRPCVILLDLMMPVMNGWAFRQAQRADAQLASIPVIVLTGVANGTREAASLGAAQCLTKPFRLEPLLDAVHTYCGSPPAP